MRTSYLLILVAVSVAACAHHIETSSTAVGQWKDRDISKLIDTIGPYDTTTIKGDSRTYNWFRLGNCRLTAHTSLDDKIQTIDLEETGQACEVYRQKLGGG